MCRLGGPKLRDLIGQETSSVAGLSEGDLIGVFV